jgi:DUF4097 and DUF4098 domain-containing protein YvlB
MPVTALLQRSSQRAALVAACFLALGLPPPAAAGQQQTDTVDRTVAISPGGTLSLKTFSGRVEITGADRSDVAVHAVRRGTRERLDRVTLDIRAENGNVTIEANRKTGAWSDRDNVVETDFTIQVPRTVRLDIQSFSSPVVVRQVAGANHKIKTFSGDVRLEQVGGPLSAETFSGVINATPQGWSAGEQLRLQTFSGNIEVRLPEQAAGSVEFDSFSGSLDATVPLMLRGKSKRSLRAELSGADGAARGDVRLKTFSGDVRLTR